MLLAETLNPQFQQWVADGKIVWLGGLFEEAMLDEVYFVIAATDDDGFNRRIFEAGGATGEIMQYGGYGGFVFVYRACRGG